MADTYRIRNSARDLGTWPSRKEIFTLGAELDERYGVDHGDVDLVRAALARWGRPTPQPPVAGEAAGLVAELRHFIAEYQQMGRLDPENIYSIHQGIPEKEAILRISRLTRVADLLQHQHPHPVAVSERQPGPEDCEAGECWAWDTAAESWNRTHYALCNHFTHWLPAHALPTPEVKP